MIEYYPVRLEKLDRQKWDKLVESRGTFFHSSNWLSIWEKSFPFQSGVYLAVEDGAIIGGIPFCLRSKFNFKEAYSMPRGCYGGALAEAEAEDEVLRNIGSEFAYWCMREGFTRINIIEFSSQVNTSLESFQVRPLSAHVLNLKYSSAEQLQKLADSHRRNLPSAFEQGFSLACINSTQLVRDYFILLQETATRQGREPYYRQNFYLTLLEILGNNPGLLWPAVFAEGKMLASAIFLIHRNMIIYWDGVSSAEALEKGANFFLFWSIVQKSREEGIELFNFGASPKKHPGLKRFKAGWGAERVTYFEYDYQKPLSKFVSRVRGLF